MRKVYLKKKNKTYWWCVEKRILERKKCWRTNRWYEGVKTEWKGERERKNGKRKDGRNQNEEMVERKRKKV